EQQAYAHLQSIVKNRHIDIIISDNRYYFRHENIISILLCHQLSPELPKGFSLFKRQFQKRVAHLMNHFDEVWVPDFEAKNSLSGQLSINPFLEIPAIHIGVLSRFDELPASDEKEKHVLIASGPQPQLDILISEFIRIYSSTVTSLTIITSSPYNNKNTLNNVEVLVLSSDEEFAYRIQSASHIISRSGYSSVMDFIALNRTALLIPTPGQTEQEYLAEHLKKFGFSSMKQKDLLTTTSPEGLIKPKKLNLQRDIHKSLSENIKRLINEISQNE
ncbi:MAG: glycosyltransferase, partial [Bacteroidia bacterium]